MLLLSCIAHGVAQTTAQCAAAAAAGFIQQLAHWNSQVKCTADLPGAVELCSCHELQQFAGSRSAAEPVAVIAQSDQGAVQVATSLLVDCTDKRHKTQTLFNNPQAGYISCFKPGQC
jgi:hypothetical protein